ncbi:MAG: Ni-sirohydrochlorin a,c-diamide reductive cyclase ATP-dependent reductase subunit [Methanocorpusculum sp.]|uniref:Ni-sirohydrochlorin a,c-diamide reductive cyclase ATP-dependent reductase subunit n=1 Tax=Methanocorpusculum sp. TaxID=2058474 RepID=UPI002722D7B6|nr:Ni-sirohydrochlorin a,c-diamide reductive cyclase ATP-dependent reductase subunit [Methanocorpusculum sp.]MDO9522989.1 Ni-sirohydrochlorin a,c-diamide reductive cyclase ATP-dependent reductase subunit [Methanocorpusculum sp.]
MRQIALYGKGGIGKSTTSANLSAAFSEMDLDVMQIGCDPKHDSTRMLMHGRWIPTVLEQMYDQKKIKSEDIIYQGFGNIRCVEAGGPEPGIGCAGRGIIATFQLLEKMNSLYGDVIVYDVLGDVVCGGFAMPMRDGYAQEVYLVTSGELMSLYAANNICKAIARISERSTAKCRLAGVICNARNMENEQELVEEFAKRIGSKLICYIPRSNSVRTAEVNQMTVIEHDPTSEQAAVYRDCAKTMLDNTDLRIPTPLELEELEELAREYL